MKKLYRYEVKIYKGPQRYSMHTDCFETTEVEVGLENDDLMVINDTRFTVVAKDRNRCTHYQLNKPEINIRSGQHSIDEVLGTGVFYTLYSSRKKRPTTIQKEIREALKKFSWMAEDIDLSIVR